MDKGDIANFKKELKDILDLTIQKENTNTIPNEGDVSKKSKAKNLQCSVLFVDMRNSTKMMDEQGRKNMTKIYKMFARTVIKSVEECNGKVMQIMGDGMLCLFVNENEKNSGQLAVDAVRNINTYVQNSYNPIVSDDWKIQCGMGICSGHIFITRIGIRGEDKCCQLAFPSSVTNYASKYCGEAEGYEVIFDEETYKQINQHDKGEAKLSNKYGKCYSIKDAAWIINK